MSVTQKLAADTVKSAKTPIRKVRVVVHTTGAVGPNTSDNHWSIYLILASGSLRVNMRAEYGDPTGILEWTLCPYTESTSQVRAWDLECIDGAHVGLMAQMIYNWRRDRYEMSGGGSGCRYWIYTILHDAGHAKLLKNAEAYKEIWEPLQFRYHTQKEPKKINWVTGTFL